MLRGRPFNNRASKILHTALQWRRIEALFMALGATKDEKRGSSVTFELNGKTVTLHRPHPRKEANRYQIRDARDFLKRVGITL